MGSYDQMYDELFQAINHLVTEVTETEAIAHPESRAIPIEKLEEPIDGVDDYNGLLCRAIVKINECATRVGISLR